MSDSIIEKIEFMTQIHTSWDDSEQRMALRNEPRRYISYDYTGMEAWQSQYLRMITFGQQTQLIELPLWHAAYMLENTSYKGQAAISVKPEVLWKYRNIGSVLLWHSDQIGGTKYGLKYIMASGVLGLTSQLTKDYMRGATTVIPVGIGVLQQEDQYETMHSDLTALTINMELIQNQKAPFFPESFNENHDESVPCNVFNRGLPQEYTGVDIFSHEPSWSANITSSYSRNANRLDNQTGVFRFDLKSNETTETKEINFSAFSRAEINNLQRFFYRCKGAWKSFCMPTWVNDIELAQDAYAGQINLLVKFNLYWKYYSKSKRRKTLVVFYTDNTVQILKIAGYSTNYTGELGKIYLENPLKRTIVKRSVRMISYLCRCRFASDTMTIYYETSTGAQAKLSFQEVDA